MQVSDDLRILSFQKNYGVQLSRGTYGHLCYITESTECEISEVSRRKKGPDLEQKIVQALHSRET